MKAQGNALGTDGHENAKPCKGATSPPHSTVAVGFDGRYVWDCLDVMRPYSKSVLGLCLALLAVVGAGGCRLMVNPFVDELADQPRVTTASASQARAAHVSPLVLHRPYAAMELTTVDGVVTHGPLYFQDPFVSCGSEDDRFAWTGEDLLSFFYGPARFGANAAFSPISTIVTPPWMVMASEARTDRNAVRVVRDADRSKASPGTGG